MKKSKEAAPIYLWIFNTLVTEELNQNRVGNTYKVIVDSIEDGMYNGRAYFEFTGN